MYLFDTNILIYLQKKRSRPLLEKIEQLTFDKINISIFTVAELVFGCRKSNNPIKNHSALLEFLLPFNVMYFNQSDCDVYCSIRANLEIKGTPIGTIDTFIASQVLSRDLILVTNNEREFGRVVNLKFENWT